MHCEIQVSCCQGPRFKSQKDTVGGMKFTVYKKRRFASSTNRIFLWAIVFSLKLTHTMYRILEWYQMQCQLVEQIFISLYSSRISIYYNDR